MIQQVKIFRNLYKCQNPVSSLTKVPQITPYKFAPFPFEASQVLQILYSDPPVPSHSPSPHTTSSQTSSRTISYPSSFYLHLPAYEDGTECSETSAYKLQTPGNYPKESIQNSTDSLNLILFMWSPTVDYFIY